MGGGIVASKPGQLSQFTHTLLLVRCSQETGSLSLSLTPQQSRRDGTVFGRTHTHVQSRPPHKIIIHPRRDMRWAALTTATTPLSVARALTLALTLSVVLGLAAGPVTALDLTIPPPEHPEDPAANMPGVLALHTEADLHGVLGGPKAVFVEFYAPWCFHCKKLSVHMRELGKMLSREAAVSAAVVVAKMNVDKLPEVRQNLDIKGFPTLRWYPAMSTTPVEFTGKRDADGMLLFIKQKLGMAPVPPPEQPEEEDPDSAVVVLTEENFDQVVMDSSKSVFVMFYAPWCGHCKKMKPDLEKVAKHYRGEQRVVIAKLDCTTQGAVATRFGVKAFPTLKYFPAGDKQGLAYEKGRDPWSLIDHINAETGLTKPFPEARPPPPETENETTESIPGVVDLTPQNYEEIMSGKRHVFLEVFAPWCGHCKAAVNELRKLGEMVVAHHPDRSQVVVAKLNGHAHGELRSKLGVRAFPTFKWFPKGEIPSESSGVLYKQGRTAATMAAFINEQSGMDIFPVEKDTFAVFEITDRNVESLLKVPRRRPVFVMFYAPWCGHCTAMKPAFQDLASHFAPQEAKILVARVNVDKYQSIGQENDVQGFPTLKLFPAGSGDPVDYTSGRNLADMKQFLEDYLGKEGTVDVKPSPVVPSTAKQDTQSTTKLLTLLDQIDVSSARAMISLLEEAIQRKPKSS